MTTTAAPQAISRSTRLALAGAAAGGLGTTFYFVWLGIPLLGVFGLPLSGAGFALGTAALFFRPRSTLLAVVAVLLSAPTLAYVLIAVVAGIVC